MDILDLAKQQEEFALQASLANHRQGAPGESARLCCECEVEIPEGRRLAVPGCQRSKACQQAFERGELWP